MIGLLVQVIILITMFSQYSTIRRSMKNLKSRAAAYFFILLSSVLSLMTIGIGGGEFLIIMLLYFGIVLTTVLIGGIVSSMVPKREAWLAHLPVLTLIMLGCVGSCLKS